MSTIVDKQLRDKLKEHGVWEDFRRRCVEVKSSEGVGEKCANRIVLDEMASAGRIPSEIVPVKKRVGFRARKAEEPSLKREMFDGKSCSYSESIVWAYDNHRFVDANPEDAPSAMAWNMLLDMRQSPGVKADWMGKCITKWMARAEDGDDCAGVKWDGEVEYDLLSAVGRGADS